MRSFSINDTTISFRQDEETNGICTDNYKHYTLFAETMSFLSSINFYVGEDKDIKMNYPILSKDHKQGRSGDLEFKAERYPKGFKIMFYQNVVFENRHGGEYDFDKRKRMPYLIGKQCDMVLLKLAQFLSSKGVENDTEPIYLLAEDKIKHNFVRSCHHPQKDMNFSLSDLDGQPDKCAASYNATDRDGQPMLNGCFKYFRDNNGYLCRGKCYCNINNMWWVITDRKTIRNIACFELFDLTPEDCRKRKKPHLPPKDYVEKRKHLNECTNKELLAELKRRMLI